METNIYKLLELEPTVKDVTTIVATAKKKVAEWNSYANHPKKKMMVKGMVAAFNNIISNVIADPNILEDHENEFIKLRDEENRELEKSIRDLIPILVANGEIEEIQLDALVKTHIQFTKNDILRILGARIKQTYIDDGIEELDKSMFNGIAINLDVLKKDDLYDFLGLDRESNLKDIVKKRKEIYDDNQKHSVKNDKVTATGLLCGSVSQVLCDDNMRKKYNKSLDNLVFKSIYVKIDLAALKNKTINSNQYKVLLDDCAIKGIEKIKAEYYIDKYCKNKGIAIYKPTDSNFFNPQPVVHVINQKRCPQCHSIGCEHSGILLKYTLNDNFCAFCTKVK